VLISREREKLCQAVLYFAHNTRKLGKTKLFKLLYFLDFEHYKLTGRSVTGTSYNAWPKGPVPESLFKEFDNLNADLAQCVQIHEKRTLRGSVFKNVVPMARFSPQVFSKRELTLLECLATEYRDADSDDMVEATHLENRPWHEIYEVQGKRQQQIPYDLALARGDAELMRRQAIERNEVIRNYKKDTDGSGNDTL